MRIGIITYDHPHRKTQDLIYHLVLMGYSYIDLILLPWVERAGHVPLYQHRPTEAIQINTGDLCERMRLFYQRGDLVDILSKNKYDKILIGGAGILPPEVLEYNIINSHPGYLPNIRGLDALKWAILEGQPIGVTTYYIGKDVDTGIMIDREILPLYPTDTFHSIAQRQYELEIKMLAEAVVTDPDGEHLIAYPEYPANRRMKITDEIRMITRLNNQLSKL